MEFTQYFFCFTHLESTYVENSSCSALIRSDGFDWFVTLNVLILHLYVIEEDYHKICYSMVTLEPH